MPVRGTRLSYVVVPLEGYVRRFVTVLHGNKAFKELREEPAGYMVYFPKGHALRIRSLQDLKAYGLNRKPDLSDLQGLTDPNSPLGMLMAAQDADGRAKAWAEMEEAVIKAVTIKAGQNILTEQPEIVEDMEELEAA